nr:HNH endonuclease family protein [Aromatoleum petrolei]
MLLQEEAQARVVVGTSELGLAELAALNQNGLTVEHILPQDADNSFSIAGYGFNDEADYLQHNHRLGNLMLLEGSINSACKNNTVESKMAQYMRSSLSAVKAVAASCAGNQKFNKAKVNDRSQRLANAMVTRWPLKKP